MSKYFHSYGLSSLSLINEMTGGNVVSNFSNDSVFIRNTYQAIRSLLLLAALVFIVPCVSFAQVQIMNNNLPLLSDQVKVGVSPAVADAGTIRVNASVLNATTISVTVSTSNGATFNFATAVGIYSGSFATANKVAQSANIQGLSTTTIQVTPAVAGNYYVFVGTTNGAGTNVGFYVNTPLQIGLVTTVSSVSPLTGVLGLAKNYTVSGSNLPATLAFTIADATGCGQVSRSATSVVFSCTPQLAGPKGYIVKDAPGGNTLKTGTVQISNPVSTVTVNSVAPLTGVLGQAKNYTVSGSNLPATLAFTIADATGCGQVSRSATSVVFSCTPQLAGPKGYIVKDAPGGNTLKTGTVQISNPVSTVTVNSVAPLTGVLGLAQNYTVSGSNLPATLAFTIADATGCGQVSRSATSVVFSCMPHLTGVKGYIVKDASGGNILKQGNVTISGPLVTSVSPLTGVLGQAQNYTVNGTGLPSTAAFTISNATGCGQISYSSTSIVFQCTPQTSGVQSYIAKDAPGGNLLKTGTVQISTSTPIGTVSPLTGVLGQAQNYTVSGSNLPATLAFTISDATGCGQVSQSPTSVVFNCTPHLTGVKGYIVKDAPGGNILKQGNVTISGSMVTSVSPLTGVQGQSQNYTVNGTALPSTTAFTITNATGCGQVSYSSTSIVFQCVPQTSGAQTYTVKDAAGGNTLGSGAVNIAVANGTTGALPIIGSLTVKQANLTSNTLTFQVVLSAPLPAGYGVFLNFDDQQGNWFIDATPGGHIAVPHVGNGVYELPYTLQKPGLRSFRAGIFNTQNAANHTLVGIWSAGTTCTEPVCINAVTKVNGYGNPAVNGSGSELFNHVDVASGNYHLSATDMSVPGKGIPFSFSRAYNALLALPNKWTFGYEVRATYLANTFNREISVGPREDGRMQYYYKDMDNLWYALNPGNFDELVQNADGSFSLYTKGNRVYRFTDPAGVNVGRLQRIEDRLGNGLAFNYFNNNLTGVTDANNRNYTISRTMVAGLNVITRITDFSGRFVAYTYDANGMMASVRDMRGGFTRYSYVGTTGASRYQLATIKDPRNTTTPQVSIAYDVSGRAKTLTDGANSVTGYIYGVHPTLGQEVTGITRPAVDGLNHNRLYVLDAARTHVEARYDVKNYADAVSAADIKSSKVYQTVTDRKRVADQGLVVNTTDPKGNNTAITYDATVGRGNPKTVLDAANRAIQLTNTAIANQINLTKAASMLLPGVATAVRYQRFIATGKAQDIIDQLNNTTTRTFDANGWMTRNLNPRTFATDYAHDAFGNITQVIDAYSNKTIRTYDTLGRIQTETSPLGLLTSYLYDAHGNILKRTEQAGGITYITQYGYDANDNMIWMIDARNNRTDYSYDILNRKISESYKVGGIVHTRSYGYDALGRLATETDELNQTSQTHYTERDQLRYKVNPLLKTTVSYTYDKNNNIATVTDGENRTSTFTYDSLNRKTRADDAAGNYEAWTYNTAGQVATYRDKRGRSTQYFYDDGGHLIKVIDPNNGITTSTYDANGNLTSVTDPNLHTTTYAYDALDRRISTTLHNNSRWLYTYDANGNVLTETTPTGERKVKSYDAFNRVATLTEYNAANAITRQISYTYDANGNVLSQSSGGNTISYAYDELNRITSVTDQFNQTISYGYDKAGNRTVLTYPGNKTVRYAYDMANRLDSLTDWLNKTTRYTRNIAGQVTQVVNGNGTVTKYSYDAAGRLTLLENLKADGVTVISSHAMTLDGKGNITQSTMNLPLLPTLPPSTGVMGYDTTNQLVSAGSTSYTSDPAGRTLQENKAGVITTYNFDINDRITTINRGATLLTSYSYDLNNNRISQTQNGVETRYVIDELAPLPNVIAETNAQGAIQNYYIYGEGLVSQISAANSSHYYHFDPTGHTLALTDDLGNVTDSFAYAPYGFTTAQGVSHNPFRFVGRYGVMDDGNGLHYMRARYYKEDIKRFMSLDALHGDIIVPQSLNRLAYVQGNPVGNVDPSGLECQLSFPGATMNGNCTSAIAPDWQYSIEYDSWQYRVANGTINGITSFGSGVKSLVGEEWTANIVAVSDIMVMDTAKSIFETCHESVDYNCFLSYTKVASQSLDNLDPVVTSAKILVRVKINEIGLEHPQLKEDMMVAADLVFALVSVRSANKSMDNAKGKITEISKVLRKVKDKAKKLKWNKKSKEAFDEYFTALNDMAGLFDKGLATVLYIVERE